MRKSPPVFNNLSLYEDLLVTVIQSRITMDVASARADLLLNIFLVTLENLGTEKSFVKRVISHLEMDLLDDREAPEKLLDATADVARAIWVSRMKPTNVDNRADHETFERWEAVYHQCV